MSANQKPIDAIRREMNKRGYSIGIDTNRRDICDILGVCRKSSTKRLCSILGVEYNSKHHGGFQERQMKYLIEIENPLVNIEFQDSRTLCNTFFMVNGSNSTILKSYISNQYVVQYNNRRYIISDTPQRELSPNYHSPYMMVTIRQELKRRGYDITGFTNRNDVCKILKLPSDSTKKEICDKLGIFYVNSRDRMERRNREVILTNIYDPSHTVEFRSMAEAGRVLNIQSYQLYIYNNNPSLTVEYEGCVFNVSFTE